MKNKEFKMAFDLLPRPTKGPDGKPLLYAHPATRRNYSMRWVDNYRKDHSRLFGPDLPSAFECFLDVAARLMRDGSRLTTPIGSFAPRLRLKGDFTDPGQVTPDDVELVGIDFIPSKRFVAELKEQAAAGFYREIPLTSQEKAETDEARKQVLAECLKGGYTTAHRFSYKAGLGLRTAQRYLNDLCKGESPLLRRQKEGTTFLYTYLKQP